MKMTDAEFTRDARDRLHMTQQKMAEALGVTERAIRLWETGKISLNKSRRRHIELLLREKRES